VLQHHSSRCLTTLTRAGSLIQDFKCRVGKVFDAFHQAQMHTIV
jgi:hypothetical protein